MKFSALGAEEDDERRRGGGRPAGSESGDRGLRKESCREYPKYSSQYAAAEKLPYDFSIAWQELEEEVFDVTVIHKSRRFWCEYCVEYAKRRPSDYYWLEFLRFVKDLIGEKPLSMTYKDVENDCLRWFVFDSVGGGDELYIALCMAAENGHRLEVFVNSSEASDDSPSCGSKYVASSATVDENLASYTGHFCAMQDGTTFWNPATYGFAKETDDKAPRHGAYETHPSNDCDVDVAAATARGRCFALAKRRFTPATGRKEFNDDSRERESYNERNKYVEISSPEFADYKIRVEKLTALVNKVDQGIETLLSRQDVSRPVAAANESHLGAAQLKLRQLLSELPCKTFDKAETEHSIDAMPVVGLKSEISHLSTKTVTMPLESKDISATAKYSLAACELSEKNTDPPIHWGTLCNNCRKEIVGVRYMCGNCVDFDLCAICEDSPVCHFPDHVFVKIRMPLPVAETAAKEKMGSLFPLLKHTLYGKNNLWSESQSMTSRRSEDVSASENASSTNHKENSLDPIKPIKSIMDAEFVEDETVPDGTKFYPGQRFTKSWRVINSGSRPWNEDTSLKFLWGTKGFVPTLLEVVVPPLVPKQRGKISVEYVSPKNLGFYESHWNFVHKSHLFGHRIWCSIEVIDPDTVTKVQKVVKCDAIEVQEPENGETARVRATLEPLRNNTAEQKDLVLGDHLQEDKKTTFFSQTATPNNTPFLLSPPKSPEYLELTDEMVGLESFQDSSDMLPKDGASTASDLEFTGVSSVCSSDSEMEYIMVPMPPCFTLDPTKAPFISKEKRANRSKVASISGSSLLSSACDLLQDPMNEKVVVVDDSLSQSADCSSSVTTLCDPLLESQKKTDIQNETAVFASSSQSAALASFVCSTGEASGKNLTKISSETGEVNDEFCSTDLRNNEGSSVVGPPESSVDPAMTTNGATAEAEGRETPATNKSYNPVAFSTTVADVLHLIGSQKFAAAFSTIFEAVHQTLQDSGSDDNVEHPTEMPGINAQPTYVPQELAPLLDDMGFRDTQTNNRLVAKHNGNLEKILDDLLKLDDKDWFAHRH